MARQEVRLSGFGGQGIILAGYIIGKAVALYDKRNSTFIRSYGPESRGGACAAEVIISDGDIGYPKVSCPDVSVVLSKAAALKYASDVRDDGLLILDEDLAEVGGWTTPARVTSVPAARIAESMGRRIIANMVALGYMAARCPFIGTESLRRAIATSVPPGTEQLNLDGFNAGYEYAQRQDEGAAAEYLGALRTANVRALST